LLENLIRVRAYGHFLTIYIEVNNVKTIKLTLAYLGEQYSGWQIQPRQPHLKTIQGELQKGLKLLTGEEVQVIGAGRTDAGVNALGQVAAFRTSSSIPCDRYPEALNGILPEDIIVYKGETAGDSFHSIKDAKGKWYRYHIYAGKFPHVFFNKISVHIKQELDFAKMSEAASLFKGVHDFRSFCVSKTEKKTFIRNIKECKISQHQNFIFLDIYGDGFLHNMVRIIAGTLINVGNGKLLPDDIPCIIRAQDRTLAGPTAPARGLCLIKVDYDIKENFFCKAENLDMPPLFY